MTFLHYLLGAVGGALITSTAEYIFSYNLIDLIKDKVLSLLGQKAS